MKRLLLFFLLAFPVFQLFAQKLTALEKQIILAGPEEMLQIVQNRNLEKELFNIYSLIGDRGIDEIVTAYSASFPGITEDECMYIILKVALISSLGSGNEDGIETAFDILEFCEEIDSIADKEELPEDIQTLIESSYWKDCIAFYRLFDSDAFLRERFPEYF